MFGGAASGLASVDANQHSISSGAMNRGIEGCFI